LYVSGSITELLLKKKLEDEGYEVRRIREKWEGKKHLNHHGDFYFKSRTKNHWFVLEAKGVKSNAEKWHKLYNYNNLKNFLYAHSDKISWVNPSQDIEPQIMQWLARELPELHAKTPDLYDYEEIQKYVPPKKATLKSQAIAGLKKNSREEIQSQIRKRLEYVMSKVKVLETHFVSGTSGVSERTQATPRKDEFNLVAIDIFLRFTEHKFLFANPRQLASSGDDENHLQQNYVMGFVFTETGSVMNLSIADEWIENLSQAMETLKKDDAVKENDMQIDYRRPD
jgi:hypothetical protein